jgi:hypothetical protein
MNDPVGLTGASTMAARRSSTPATICREVTVAAIPALMAGDATGSERKTAMPRERTSDIVFNIALACLWLGLMLAGFAAISRGATNLLTLYVVVAATALTLFVRWIWQRRPG